MEETCIHRDQSRYQSIWAAIGLFLLVLPGMSRLTGIPMDVTVENSDHPAHIGFAKKLAGDWRECLPHPLYHLTLVVFSAGSPVAMPGIAAAVLSLMIAVRGFQTIQILSDHDAGSQRESRDRRWAPLMWMFLLAIAMPLPNWWKQGIYLGQPSPNVWHNPTTIFCTPIVLSLFSRALRATYTLKQDDAIQTGLLFALCALAKPNFPLAFAPCCAVMLFLRLHRHHGVDHSRFDWPHFFSVTKCGLMMLAPIMILMGIQFVLTFGSAKPESSGIEFAPFKVWKLFSPNIFGSVLLGLAFPIFVLVLYPKHCWQDASVVWAWWTLAIALIQLALLAETGPRWAHGNFLWGSLFATTIVFIYSARVVFQAPRDLRRCACEGILLFHAFSGMWYLFRAFQDPAGLTNF